MLIIRYWEVIHNSWNFICFSRFYTITYITRFIKQLARLFLSLSLSNSIAFLVCHVTWVCPCLQNIGTVIYQRLLETLLPTLTRTRTVIYRIFHFYRFSSRRRWEVCRWQRRRNKERNIVWQTQQYILVPPFHRYAAFRCPWID